MPEKSTHIEKEVGSAHPIRVGISIGDVNGIGPEVIIKALKDSRILLDCTPIIYGSTKTLSYHKKAVKEFDFQYQTCNTADEALNRKVNVVNVWNEEIPFELGKATEAGGKFAFLSLEAATKDLAEGKIDVLVTAPISKDAMQKSGFQFAGHTEYLADKAGMTDALMMMVGSNMRVALVSTHIPLKDVSSSLTKEAIFQKIKVFEKSLKADFGIIRPKIAVFGVNPHAGENGKMGTEEQDIILPAINQAKTEDILAFGPFPADGFFGSSAMNHYDGILAMYHDQGLTAFKALSFDDGVNFTAGLPVVRTSPDHGTAYDIVGQGIASEQSMRSAIYLAMDIYRNQKARKEMFANPLKIQPADKKRLSNFE
jgi:4-hydroxythreonine-4-phosphate dehydrogenase